MSVLCAVCSICSHHDLRLQIWIQVYLMEIFFETGLILLKSNHKFEEALSRLLTRMKSCDPRVSACKGQDVADDLEQEAPLSPRQEPEEMVRTRTEEELCEETSDMVHDVQVP